MQVVLRVTNVSEYSPSFNDDGSMTTGVFFNGLSGQFGQINVLSDASVDLLFSFLNKTDETPFVLDEFFFTWFDLDQNNNNFRREKVGCYDFEISVDVILSGWTLGLLVALQVILNMTFDDYFLNPQGTTVEVDFLPDNMIGFCSTVFGNTADNPMDPMDLTEEQVQPSIHFHLLSSNNVNQLSRLLLMMVMGLLQRTGSQGGDTDISKAAPILC